MFSTMLGLFCFLFVGDFDLGEFRDLLRNCGWFLLKDLMFASFSLLDSIGYVVEHYASNRNLYILTLKFQN